MVIMIVIIRAPAPVLSVHQKALLTGLWSIGAIYSILTPSTAQQVIWLVFNIQRLENQNIRC